MNDIEALLKTTIQMKVVEAFNQAPEMIDKLVEAAISKEVDEHGGKPSGYGSKKLPYMEWLVGEEIRKAITSAVKEYVQQNKEAIDARVKKAMEDADLVTPITKMLSTVMTCEYNWNINLDVKKE